MTVQIGVVFPKMDLASMTLQYHSDKAPTMEFDLEEAITAGSGFNRTGDPAIDEP